LPDAPARALLRIKMTVPMMKVWRLPQRRLEGTKKVPAKPTPSKK